MERGTRSSRLRPMYFKTSPGCRGLLCGGLSRDPPQPPLSRCPPRWDGDCPLAGAVHPAAGRSEAGAADPGPGPTWRRQEAASPGEGALEFSSPQKGRLPSRSSSERFPVRGGQADGEDSVLSAWLGKTTWDL